MGALAGRIEKFAPIGACPLHIKFERGNKMNKRKERAKGFVAGVLPLPTQ